MDWFKLKARWISFSTKDIQKDLLVVDLLPLGSTIYRVMLKSRDNDYLTFEFKNDELYEIRECKGNPHIPFNLIKFKEPVEYTFRILTD